MTEPKAHSMRLKSLLRGDHAPFFHWGYWPYAVRALEEEPTIRTKPNEPHRNKGEKCHLPKPSPSRTE